MQTINTIFTLAILIMSVVVHEVSHGFTANKLGDPTARLQGRLTLNPLKHLDPVGSILVPIITSLGGFTFGWARPVPFNPYNLRNRRMGELLIAGAGPLSNIVIALIFGLLIRFGWDAGLFSPSLTLIMIFIIKINLVLAVFNLIPIPPLDGSKILFSLLPVTFERFRQTLEQYGLFLVLLLIFFLWQFVTPVIGFLYQALTGLPF